MALGTGRKMIERDAHIQLIPAAGAAVQISFKDPCA